MRNERPTLNDPGRSSSQYASVYIVKRGLVFNRRSTLRYGKVVYRCRWNLRFIWHDVLRDVAATAMWQFMPKNWPRPMRPWKAVAPWISFPLNDLASPGDILFKESVFVIEAMMPSAYPGLRLSLMVPVFEASA